MEFQTNKLWKELRAAESDLKSRTQILEESKTKAKRRVELMQAEIETAEILNDVARRERAIAQAEEAQAELAGIDYELSGERIKELAQDVVSVAKEEHAAISGEPWAKARKAVDDARAAFIQALDDMGELRRKAEGIGRLCGSAAAKIHEFGVAKNYVLAAPKPPGGWINDSTVMHDEVRRRANL